MYLWITLQHLVIATGMTLHCFDTGPLGSWKHHDCPTGCFMNWSHVESRLCSDYIFEKTSVPTGNLWQFGILTCRLWLALGIWWRWFDGPYLFKYNVHPCSRNINFYELFCSRYGFPTLAALCWTNLLGLDALFGGKWWDEQRFF